MSVGQVHVGIGTQGGLPGTSNQSPAIKDLAARVTAGDATALAMMTGTNRKYLGDTFVSKPSWKPSMLFDKAQAASYKQQLGVFKEQRILKHQNRWMKEIQHTNPNMAVIKRSMKYLDKKNAAEVFT